MVIMVIGMTFSLAACKNEEHAKEVKKESGITKEETEEEVKYWPGKEYGGLSCFINGDLQEKSPTVQEVETVGQTFLFFRRFWRSLSQTRLPQQAFDGC